MGPQVRMRQRTEVHSKFLRACVVHAAKQHACGSSQNYSGSSSDVSRMGQSGTCLVHL